MKPLISEAERTTSRQRCKGRGEMNHEQIGDAIEASWVFTMLMGDEVEPRGSFVAQNARLVANIDV